MTTDAPSVTQASEGSVMECLNRPMFPADLADAAAHPQAKVFRDLLQLYRALGLPILNGSMEYSNFTDGPSSEVTCNPYRMWEYTSLFQVWKLEQGRVLDVGGAGSLLPYAFAEMGHHVTAVDLQPVLVEICRYVALQRDLLLEAEVRDITQINPDLEELFDLVTCVSVLEHIPSSERPLALSALCRLTKPGGLCYLTFDYGCHAERTDYGDAGEPSDSIGSIPELCLAIESSGFVFHGNHPRELSKATLETRSAPEHEAVAYRRGLNIGVVDAGTKWRTLMSYALRRLFGVRRRAPDRFAQHNFFRLFLRRPG